eukprot:3867493-Rhodomonas_salina.1
MQLHGFPSTITLSEEAKELLEHSVECVSLGVRVIPGHGPLETFVVKHKVTPWENAVDAACHAHNFIGYADGSRVRGSTGQRLRGVTRDTAEPEFRARRTRGGGGGGGRGGGGGGEEESGQGEDGATHVQAQPPARAPARAPVREEPRAFAPSREEPWAFTPSREEPRDTATATDPGPGPEPAAPVMRRRTRDQRPGRNLNAGSEGPGPGQGQAGEDGEGRSSEQRFNASADVTVAELQPAEFTGRAKAAGPLSSSEARMAASASAPKLE